MSDDPPETTTIALHRDTKERFDEAMPAETMARDEFVRMLLDRWEAADD